MASTLSILIALGALVLAACGGSDDAGADPDGSPESIVQAIADRANAGDLDGVMEYMATGVTYTFDGSILEVRTDEAEGIASVRAWFEDVIPSGFETRQEIVAVNGEVVTTDELIAWDDTRTAGGSLRATGLYTVADGLLVDWVITPTEFVTHAPGEEGDVVR